MQSLGSAGHPPAAHAVSWAPPEIPDRCDESLIPAKGVDLMSREGARRVILPAVVVAGVVLAGFAIAVAQRKSSGPAAAAERPASVMAGQATPSPAAQATTAKPTTSKAGARAVATFAGGCFWCVETAFEGMKGVESVTSGYTGGSDKDPTYDEVSSGGTGHAEAVQVVYDPRVVSYGRLLEVFWHNIDPTQKDAQFCDRGRQYRTAIFFHDEKQKALALETKRRFETTPQRFRGSIVTEILPASTFYPAEEYHQDFYRKDPERYQSYRLSCGRDRRLEQLWGKTGDHAKR
jgi:peptide-methionine (S)-S-oxide reductase